ncbi:hypothetical protein EBR96_01415 [bacterium]|nr:hypothetical protein [bacterium]
MTQLIEIRIFKSDENQENWLETPVAAYLPALITGDAMADNVARRLKVGFFKPDPEIKRIRWNLKGEPENGTWVEREAVL